MDKKPHFLGNPHTKKFFATAPVFISALVLSLVSSTFVSPNTTSVYARSSTDKDATDNSGAIAKTATRYVKTDKLKVYKKRSTKSKVIIELKRNTQVEMRTGNKGGWVKIRYVDDANDVAEINAIEGFVEKKYLSVTEITVESLRTQAVSDRKKIKKLVKKRGWKMTENVEITAWDDPYYGPQVNFAFAFKRLDGQVLGIYVYGTIDGDILYGAHSTSPDFYYVEAVKVGKIIKFIKQHA